MYLNKWGMRLALTAIMFAGVLACRTSDIFVAQSAPTPTRTPRPTFTPLPKPTFTPVPIPTNPPPPTAVPTKKPPTPRPPTPKPPTPKPVVVAPPPVVQPTAAPKFQFAANPASCTHAGNQYIKGRVYDSSDSGAGGVPGQMIALGGNDGVNIWVKIRNEDDGFYTFTLSQPGAAAGAGTYYVWMYDSGSGKRISDLGGPINMNPVGPDAPGACWAGSVDFWKRY